MTTEVGPKDRVATELRVAMVRGHIREAEGNSTAALDGLIEATRRGMVGITDPDDLRALIHIYTSGSRSDGQCMECVLVVALTRLASTPTGEADAS